MGPADDAGAMIDGASWCRDKRFDGGEGRRKCNHLRRPALGGKSNTSTRRTHRDF